MLDVGSGNVALKESARTSVAQADRFPWKVKTGRIVTILLDCGDICTRGSAAEG